MRYIIIHSDLREANNGLDDTVFDLLPKHKKVAGSIQDQRIQTELPNLPLQCFERDFKTL